MALGLTVGCAEPVTTMPTPWGGDAVDSGSDESDDDDDDDGNAGEDEGGGDAGGGTSGGDSADSQGADSNASSAGDGNTDAGSADDGNDSGPVDTGNDTADDGSADDGADGSTSGADDGNPDTGEPGDTGNNGSPGAVIGSFQLTYYWIASEEDHPGATTRTLYNPDCQALANVSQSFEDALTLEGTGRLNDGRVLNYWNTCGCANSPCFFEVDASHPWGHGVQNRALAPYRSLAVDTGVLSIGDAIYVEELDGVVMPGDTPWGNFVHDGCLVADDIGGAINGQHLDFFVGLRDSYLSINAELGLSSVTVHQPGDRCSSYGD